MPLFGPKSWNIYQYFSRNLKILTRCIKYISPPLDTFKTWRSGATHIKPWAPSCCVLSCLAVLALLWHSMLGQVNPWISFSECDFWSQGFLNPQDLWIHVRSFVRPYVRHFPRNPRIRLFSWSLGSINVKKWQFRFFTENSKLALFWPKKGPKLAIFGQNSSKSVFFALIFKSTHQIFLIFPMNPRFHKCKKMSVSLFCRKFKIGPFLAKNG